MAQTHPIYGRIDGPIVIIGFGSIGKGTWPLIERHFDYDADKLVVVEPDPAQANFLRQHRLHHVQEALTPENYRDVLGRLLVPGKGFCVNLSVDTSSLDLMRFCREIGVPYIDTVVEPWAGYYFGTADNAARTNYALRQAVRDEKAKNPGGTTAVSCCGANPGMVSWFVKEALLTLARDTGHDASTPKDRAAWAALMRDLGVKGVHIAERDTHRPAACRARAVCSSIHGRSRASSPKGSSRPSLAGARMSHGFPRTAIAMIAAVRPRSGWTVPARSRVCIAGARRRGRNSAFSSRITRRSRSRITTLSVRVPRRRIGRLVIMPITLAMTRC